MKDISVSWINECQSIDSPQNVIADCQKAIERIIRQECYTAFWDSCVKDFERKKVLANIIKGVRIDYE